MLADPEVENAVDESINLDIEVDLFRTNIASMSRGSSRAGVHLLEDHLSDGEARAPGDAVDQPEHHRPGSRNLHAQILRKNIFTQRQREKSFHRLLRRSTNPSIAAIYNPSIQSRAATPGVGRLCLPLMRPPSGLRCVSPPPSTEVAAADKEVPSVPRATLRSVLLDLREKMLVKPPIGEHKGDLRPFGTSASMVYGAKLRASLLSCTDACGDFEPRNCCFPANIFFPSPRQNPDVLLEKCNVRRELAQHRNSPSRAQRESLPSSHARPSSAEVDCLIQPTRHVSGVRVSRMLKPTDAVEPAMKRHHAVTEATAMRRAKDTEESQTMSIRKLSAGTGAFSATLNKARGGVVKRVYNQ
jgi:hypothetical protein